MSYLYETHLHTKEASACGISGGREYIARYLDLGYTGIIVTDHFYNGNCCVVRSHPWEKWVHEFCRGYENAREEGERRGLDVFFGWEQAYEGDDYLVYGLGKEWLLEHPELNRWTRKEQYEEVRRYGGCVVQAHPFRERDYIHCIHLFGGVDAVEIANATNERSFDALAWAYAKKIGVPVTAGSDIHNAADAAPDKFYGVYLDKKIESLSEYVDAVRGNAIAGLKIPDGRCDLRGDERIALPVDIQDRQDCRIEKDIMEFLGI